MLDISGGDRSHRRRSCRPEAGLERVKKVLAALALIQLMGRVLVPFDRVRYSLTDNAAQVDEVETGH